MPQYRHNLITNRWVILATHRKGRPHNFARSNNNQPPSIDHNCPFCPGNEKMTPPETFALRDNTSPGDAADSSGWSIRVVPNKFPFLDLNADNTTSNDASLTRPALGLHEVLIESPRHNVHFAHHELNHASLILRTLRDRCRCLAKNDSIKHISAFCNHGRSSGASLAHPHFQIAAAPMIPPRLSGQIEYCQNYYRTHKRSVFDATIENELDSESRLITTNDNFIAVCPSASMCPFEVYVLPRFSQPRFDHTSDEIILDLTAILQQIMIRLDEGLGQPDYNLVIHTAPIDYTGQPEAFRWYIQLYPRVSIAGGFELATDIYVNMHSPESAADFYR